VCLQAATHSGAVLCPPAGFCHVDDVQTLKGDVVAICTRVHGCRVRSSVPLLPAGPQDLDPISFLIAGQAQRNKNATHRWLRGSRSNCTSKRLPAARPRRACGWQIVAALYRVNAAALARPQRYFPAVRTQLISTCKGNLANQLL
jgi:hypothetical protein